MLRDGGRYLLGDLGPDRAQPADRHRRSKRWSSRFPDNPPLFMRDGPFSYHDAGADRSATCAPRASTRVEIETVELNAAAARRRTMPRAALCYGTPMGVEIEERGPGSLERVFEAVEQALRASSKAPTAYRRADVGAHRDRDQISYARPILDRQSRHVPASRAD